MKWIKCVVALAIALMFAVPVSAQAFDNVHMQWVSGSGQAAYGYQVGPYHAMSGLGQQQMDIFCVDFYNYANTSRRGWNANFTALDGGNVASRTRYGMANTGSNEAGVVSVYRQAAYLAQQFGQDNRPQWGDIHSAIWYLMSGRQYSNATVVDGLLRDAADNAAAGVDLGEWYVVTDVRVTTQNAGARYATSQEFLTQANVVPEPATIILMGTGLLVVAGVTVVRRRQSAG